MIEIEFDQINRHSLPVFNDDDDYSDCVIKPYLFGGISQHELIFTQQSSQDYPIDKKIVQIKNIQQGIEPFGVIYQNVFKWLQTIQAQSSSNAQIAISGCKVALLV